MSCGKLPSGACWLIRSLRVSRLADRHDTGSNISAPLCQERAADGALADDFGLVEEVGGQDGAGVEDLDAGELAAVPVERDEGVEAGRGLGAGRGLAGWRRLAGEVQVGGVGLPVVGDPHVLIVPCRSVRSW